MNMAVIIEANYRFGYLSRPWPEQGRTYSIWRIEGHSIRIEAKRDTLLLVAADGGTTPIALPGDYVTGMLKHNLTDYDDFRKSFATLLPATPGPTTRAIRD
jgi:hypothetical protein